MAGAFSRRRLLAGLGLLVLSGGTANGQSPAPTRFPAGIFSLGPGREAVPQAILDHSQIRGVVLRSAWQPIERREGEYDWSYFEREIKRVAGAGKGVSLRLIAGGQNTPAWVTNLPGVEKFGFEDTSAYRKNKAKTGIVMPVFWDPTFLQKKKQLIKAWGERFGADPNVITVGASCANATTGDWHFPADTEPERQSWRKLGYSPDKLIAACKEIIDATAAAFPGKIVAVSVNAVKLDTPTDIVARRVVEYGYAKYPGRFMAMRSNLSAKTIKPGGRNQREEWKLIHDHRPWTGAQMLWYVAGDSTLRMAAKNDGSEKGHEIFRRAVEIALDYGMSYLEIYQEDLLDREFADVVARAAAELDKRGGKKAP